MAQPVQFDFGKWIARYPELASIEPAQAQALFDEATIYHANDGTGPIRDDTQQLALLGMIVAHLAVRGLVINGVIPSPFVGIVTGASEGSVSVSSSFNAPTGSQQYWFTTKYGYSYWFAMAPYRTAHYRPGPRRILDPFALPRGLRGF